MTNNLRVGICSCSSNLHNKLNGQTLKVGVGVFKIKEVLIESHDGAGQYEELKAKSCDFFVDVHRIDHRLGKYWTIVTHWKSDAGFTMNGNPEYLLQKRPPTPKQIIERIKFLFDIYHHQ